MIDLKEKPGKSKFIPCHLAKMERRDKRIDYQRHLVLINMLNSTQMSFFAQKLLVNLTDFKIILIDKEKVKFLKIKLFLFVSQKVDLI